MSKNGRLTCNGASLISYSDIHLILASENSSLVLPSGGTWKYFFVSMSDDFRIDSMLVGEAAGGTILHTTSNVGIARGICFRA